MPTIPNPGDDALLIGKMLLFEIEQGRISDIARPEYQIKLEKAQSAVLLQFAWAPEIVLKRQQMREAISAGYDIQISDQTLDELVSALRAAFRQVAPGAAYIRTLPRLGYVLVGTVTPIKP